MNDLTEKTKTEVVNLNINAEQINKYIAEMVMKSTLGNLLEDEIKKTTTKVIEDTFSSNYNNRYNNPLKDYITSVIKHYIREKILDCNYQDIINKKLNDYFKENHINEIIESGVNNFTKNFSEG